MTSAELRELRIRATLGHATASEVVLDLIETLEDALAAAEISDTDELWGAIQGLAERPQRSSEEWDDLEEERDKLRERVTALETARPIKTGAPVPDGQDPRDYTVAECLDCGILDAVTWEKSATTYTCPRCDKPGPTEPSPDPKVLRVAFGTPNARPIRSAEDAKAAASALYDRANVVDEDAARQQEAAHLYREAIALDPTLAIAHTNLGNCLLRLGQGAEAVGCYNRALGLAPKQPEAHYNLGWLALEAGEAERAVTLFTSAVRFDPKFADAYYNLAQALEIVGRGDDARDPWTRYLELEPDGDYATTARARLALLPPTPARKPRKKASP